MQRVMASCRAATVAVLALFAVSHPAANAEPTSIDEWHEADAATYVFDSCGDGALGMQWRQALTRVLDECPNLAAVKPELLNDAANMAGAFQSKSKGVTFPPDHVLDGTHTCGEILASAPAVELRRRLAAFAQGKLSAKDALATDCDAAPGRSASIL